MNMFIGNKTASFGDGRFYFFLYLRRFFLRRLQLLIIDLIISGNAPMKAIITALIIELKSIAHLP